MNNLQKRVGNLQAFKKAVKLQREFRDLYENHPITSLNPDNVHLGLGFFNELVGKGIIYNVKKKRDDVNKVVHLTGQINSGDVIIAVDSDGYKKEKNKERL